MFSTAEIFLLAWCLVATFLAVYYKTAATRIESLAHDLAWKLRMVIHGIAQGDLDASKVDKILGSINE